jgi:hypothetical protein
MWTWREWLALPLADPGGFGILFIAIVIRLGFSNLSLAQTPKDTMTCHCHRRLDLRGLTVAVPNGARRFVLGTADSR